MNNHTLFFSDLTTLLLYAAGLGLLSLSNPRFRALRWFFATELLFVVKTVLQGLKGSVPNFFSYFLANVLVVVAFYCMYRGFLHSTGHRQKRRGVVLALALPWLLAYYVVYSARRSESFLLFSAPVLAFCVFSILLLLRPGRPEFRLVSRIAAGLIFLHAAVLIFRTIITLHLSHPDFLGETLYQQAFDFSMLTLAFLDAALVGCFIWFYVADLHRELHRLAITDALTGALNRRALEAEAQREIARCIRNGSPMSIALLDIDHFKRLNDSLGHAAGDAALKSLVAMLRHECRAADQIARSGGEEFIFLLPDTALEQAIEAAERLRAAVESQCSYFEGEPLRLTISIGVSSLDLAQPDWELMLRRAGKALYQAKAAGRNCVVSQPGVTQPEMLSA
jgi:diguanylate cyclase (GGDEF)-like protein